jgi:hypothetical protein
VKVVDGLYEPHKVLLRGTPCGAAVGAICCAGTGWNAVMIADGGT